MNVMWANLVKITVTISLVAIIVRVIQAINWNQTKVHALVSVMLLTHLIEICSSNMIIIVHEKNNN